MKKTVASLFAAALLGTTALAPMPLLAQPTPQAPVIQQRAGFADLVERVKPAVVNIAVTEKAQKAEVQNIPEPFRHFFQQMPQRGPRRGVGSGFVIDPDGWIVTNNHVVDTAEKVVVTLEDGTELPAVVKARDSKTDIALIKVEAGKKLPALEWGDSDQVRVGEWVVAVGNPFGLGGTVTAGILSARNRDISDGPYDYLQIDAPINPGNSGGPLFDQTGRVIGIDTAIYSPTGGSVGIGFAVPSNLASKVVAQLKEKGTIDRGWLGIAMQTITPDLARALGREKAEGALVASVQPDSPAAKAGLQQGDVVIAAGGEPIRTPRDLARIVADARPGTRLDMNLARDGKERTLPVTVGAPQEQTASLEAPEEGVDSGPKVGLALAPLTAQARSQLGLDSSAKGAVVASVEPGSPAAESGLRRGDVIVKVGDRSVDGPRSVAAELRAARKDRRAVPVLVLRDGTPYYVALELGRA
jgi:serine protease Do